MKPTGFFPKLFSPLLAPTLLLLLASMPFAAQAAHEADIDLSAPDNQELLIPEISDLISINGIMYRQTTAYTENAVAKIRTTISDLNGEKMGWIDYKAVYQNSQNGSDKSPDYAHDEKIQGEIYWIVVDPLYRNKKIGIGKYLMNFVHDFYRQQKTTHIKLLALPSCLTEKDLQLTPRQRMERIVNYYKSLDYRQLEDLDDEGGTMMVCYLREKRKAELAAQSMRHEYAPQPADPKIIKRARTSLN